MATFSFQGILAFLGQDAEVVNAARHSREVSQIGELLGQCADSEDPAVQADILAEATRLRDRLAAHLAGVDAAFEHVRRHVRPAKHKGAQT